MDRHLHSLVWKDRNGHNKYNDQISEFTRESWVLQSCLILLGGLTEVSFVLPSVKIIRQLEWFSLCWSVTPSKCFVFHIHSYHFYSQQLWKSCLQFAYKGQGYRHLNGHSRSFKTLVRTLSWTVGAFGRKPLSQAELVSYINGDTAVLLISMFLFNIVILIRYPTAELHLGDEALACWSKSMPWQSEGCLIGRNRSYLSKGSSTLQGKSWIKLSNFSYIKCIAEVEIA